MGVIEDYKDELFFAIIAEPSLLRELVQKAPTSTLIRYRDKLALLKSRKIDGNEAQVGQILGFRIGAVADKLTEVINERGD